MHCDEDLVHREEHLLDVRRAHGVVQTARDALAFEALRDGRVTLDTQFRVSTKAKNMGGSTMFLNETDRPTVEELIKGIIVLSGNDACVVVAEGLAGTEEAFARMMNDRARALGMSNSTFANASGWPAPSLRFQKPHASPTSHILILHRAPGQCPDQASSYPRPVHLPTRRPTTTPHASATTSETSRLSTARSSRRTAMRFSS